VRAGKNLHAEQLKAIEQVLDAHNVSKTRPDGQFYENPYARIEAHFGGLQQQNRTLASTGAMADTAGPDPTKTP
jgi:hypothetical protein